MTIRSIFILTAVLSGLVLPAVYAGDKLPEPAGWWKLDEGVGTVIKDATGNNRNGRLIHNGYWSEGVSGSALEFVGPGAVVVPASGRLNISDSITISAWIRLNNYATTVNIIKKYNDYKNGSWYISLNTKAPYDKLRFVFIDENGRYREFESKNTIPLGKWVHIAVTYQNRARLYVNGVETVCDELNVAIKAAPTEKLYIGSDKAASHSEVDTYLDGAIDDVRIYDTVLTKDEIKSLENTVTIGSPSQKSCFLSYFRTVDSDYNRIKPSFIWAYDKHDNRLPLVLKNKLYREGLAFYSNTTQVYDIKKSFVKFKALFGINDISGSDSSAVLKIFGDGRLLFDSGNIQKRSKPKDIDIDVKGLKLLKIVFVGKGKNCCGVLADSMLKTESCDFPQSSCAGLFNEATPVDIIHPEPFNRTNCQKCSFNADELLADMTVAVKNYLDEIDLSVLPGEEAVSNDISGFAAQDEYEPLSFVIYAAKDIKNISVKISDLLNGDEIIPYNNIKIRTVIRKPIIDAYWLKDQSYAVRSRYLPRFSPFDLAAGEFREIWLTVKVPKSAISGVYKGRVLIRSSFGVVKKNVSFEVLPFSLRDSGKYYGLYTYRFDLSSERRQWTINAFKDMREHGMNSLFCEELLTIEYKKQDGRIIPDYSKLTDTLEVLKKLGFSGKLIMSSGLDKLAELSGYETDHKRTVEDYDKIDKDVSFQKTAKDALAGLMRIQKKYSQTEFLLTASDELFCSNWKLRTKEYITFMKIAKQAGFRTYATLHFDGTKEWNDNLHRIVDPYVNLRAYNGWTLDRWLVEHSVKELKQRLDGDEGWFYYNPVGGVNTPKRRRLLDGLFFWSTGLSGDMQWCYCYYHGSPYDNFDVQKSGLGNGYDYGSAFPSSFDKVTPVPTKSWEACREGIDDMRYIATLNYYLDIAKNNPAAGEKANEAKEMLDDLKEDLSDKSYVAVRNNRLTGSIMKEMSPVIYALDSKMSGDDFQKLRREIAKHIIELKKLTTVDRDPGAY